MKGSMNILPPPPNQSSILQWPQQKISSSQFKNRIHSITKIDRTPIFSFFFLTAKITMTELNDQNVKILVQNCIKIVLTI